MPVDRMPEQGVVAGAYPHGQKTHLLPSADDDEDSIIGERPFNPDPLAPPWERRQDWTTIGFDEDYCKELDKANGVTGIGTQYYIALVRNPNAFTGDNRPRQVKAEMPGSFVIKPSEKGSDVVGVGEDLIAMAIPMKYKARQQRDILRALEKDERGSHQNPRTGETTRPGVKAWPTMADRAWSELSAAEKQDIMEQQQQMHRSSGMIGTMGSNVTAGLPLREAEIVQERRAAAGKGPTVEAEERQYREGGRAVPKSPEEFMKLMMTGYEQSDRVRKVVAAEVSRKKSFAVGGGPAVSPRSPLGRAQARERAER